MLELNSRHIVVAQSANGGCRTIAEAVAKASEGDHAGQSHRFENVTIDRCAAAGVDVSGGARTSVSGLSLRGSGGAGVALKADDPVRGGRGPLQRCNTFTLNLTD